MGTGAVSLIKALNDVIRIMIFTLIVFLFFFSLTEGLDGGRRIELNIKRFTLCVFIFICCRSRTTEEFIIQHADVLTWQDVVVAVLSSVLRQAGDVHRLVSADILQILEEKKVTLSV